MWHLLTLIQRISNGKMVRTTALVELLRMQIGFVRIARLI